MIVSSRDRSDSRSGEHGALGRREQRFRSLLELSRQVSLTHELDGIADLVLFNLMGQLATSRAALWLQVESDLLHLIPVRSYGFRTGSDALSPASIGPDSLAALSTEGSPRLVENLGSSLSANEVSLLESADVRIVASLASHGEFLGLILVGASVHGAEHGPAELEFLEIALGVAATSLQNARLFEQQRQLGERLRRQNEMLLENDRLKTQFLANTNHELRTPLTIIRAALECVLEVAMTPEQSRLLLQSSLRNAVALSEVVERTLAFSDSTRHRTVSRAAPADAVALVRNFLAQRNDRAHGGAHELVFAADDAVPCAVLDSEQLPLVLAELLDNAKKFAPARSRIDVRVSARLVQDGPKVAIEFMDRGPGIAPEQLTRIFESFVQGDGSSTRLVGGLGLGLALCKRLVESMGGRIEVESEPGKGSTFRVLLIDARNHEVQAAA